MTDPDAVIEGGLDEPAELQPAEGSLRLVGDDDSYDAAAWEAATAAVLRKARRLGEDAPDSDVWAVLTRTTLDGIDVAPIGQQSDLDGLVTSGRPQRAGAWDVRASLVGDDAAAVNEAALVDLDNGATSLHLDLEPGTDLGAALDGVLLDLAPVTLQQPGADQSEALARLLEEGFEGACVAAGALHDPVAAAVLCAPSTIDHSWVAGRPLVADRQVVGVEVNHLVEQHNMLARDLVG